MQPTHVERLESLHGSALVGCRFETGPTHQIRVHLSEQGHPVLADRIYGHSSRDPRLQEAAAAVGRQALHAALLAFDHPGMGQRFQFEVELPPDMQRALALLRG